MEINANTVKYVANLSRMELKDDELSRLAVQLKDILDFIDKLNQLDTSKVDPTSHILDVSNVLRADQQKESLAIEKVLGNAPDKKDSFFEVPKVIE